MAKISKKNLSGRSGFRRAIEGLIGGLEYVSETDAPFELVSGPRMDEISVELVRSQFGIGDDVRIEEFPVDDFFKRLTDERDWYGPAEKKRAERFRKLADELSDRLSQLKVFRAGRVRIDIYIVGLDSNGQLAGIKTRAVET